MFKKFILIFAVVLPTLVLAEGSFFSRIYLGANILGNQEITQEGVASEGADGNIKQTSLGYRTGFSLGYAWSERFSTELTFDYLTNSAETKFSDGKKYPKGDYSSRLHFLNNFYHFSRSGKFRPFVGFGLGIIEEIDIDLEDSSGEQSFSDKGGLGYQLIVGTDYQLSSSLDLGLELTNISFNGPRFKSESGNSKIKDEEGYGPWNVNLSLKYHF